MILACAHCGYVWEYQGEAEKETSCPKCKNYIHLKNRRVDKELGDLGDYSGAEWIGVSMAEPPTLLYYDGIYTTLIEFLGEPDPFSRYETLKIKESELEDYVKSYCWEIGFKYKNKEFSFM